MAKFVLKAGADATHISVAWVDAFGTTAPEERELLFNNTAVLPAKIQHQFSLANEKGLKPEKAQEIMREVGRALWDCLNGGAAGVAFQKARKGTLDRLAMDLTEAPDDWRYLPWEALHDGRARAALMPDFWFVRLQEYDNKPPKLVTGWPYRVLIVCGEAEGAAIGISEELDALEDAFWPRRREIIYHTLVCPNAQKLQEEMRSFQPHVLHFMGHGSSDALEIASSDQTGKSWQWTAEDMQTWLSQGAGPTPHLVVLNACYTQTKTSVSDSISLAESFLVIGVPAVIGMTEEVNGGAARLLAKTFYSTWIAGDDINQAMTKARLAISTAFADEPVQCFLPCMAVQQDPWQSIVWSPPVPQADYWLGQRIPKKLLETFVGRNRERGDIFNRWLKKGLVHLDQPPKSEVVVVTGVKEIGKTDMVCMILKAMLFRGWIARCHTVEGKNWLETLRTLSKGDSTGMGFSDPLSDPRYNRPQDTSFAEFDAFAAKFDTPVTGGPAEARIDVEQHQTDAFTKWGAGLRELLQKGLPVALALDPQDSTGDLPEWLKLFAQHIIKKVLNGQIQGPLLIILVMNDAEWEKHSKEIENLVGTAPHAFSVSPLGPPDEATRVGKLYFRQRYAELEKLLAHVPGVLAPMREICRQKFEEKVKPGSSLNPKDIEIGFKKVRDVIDAFLST